MMHIPNLKGENLQFNVFYGDVEVTFELPYYNTVGDLKMAIYHRMEIPPSKQVIDCWYKSPESDNDTLGLCCQSQLNYLVVYNSDYLILESDEDAKMSVQSEDIKNLEELEFHASLDFIEYFSKNFDDHGVLFHVCRLEDAINEACFTTLESRKILLLYFHNKNDKFANIFGENLTKLEVKEMLDRRFFLLGWDVGNEEYHIALTEALSKRTELSTLINFIEKKICAALLIVPIKNSFTLFSCIKSQVSKKDFLETLKKGEEFFITENRMEQDLAQAEQSVNDIGSISYQQLMLDLLGDRDYDSFDHFEFDHLKKKIGYAFYGPPQLENGYNEKQQKNIEYIFKIIVTQNNIFAKWKDRIVISFIYNCTEPLPSKKRKRLKKYNDYNPGTDLNPIPLFVLRKCKNSENPCRIIIDGTGRVYKTWAEYLTGNKLTACEMILPMNGRYQADENGNVILERHLSPACGIDYKILQGADMANTAAGFVSGGIVIAALIPGIAVAPVALAVAGATGIGVGLYSIGRSAYTLYDRSKHKETLSFVNSEARGAYLNIVAGSLGFAGAGANIALTQLAGKGFNIGQGATAAMNVLNVANIGASGINVVNSGYDVFDQWWNENRTPSLLTMVQLSSSILFFGHAVYNFRMANKVIEESQAKTLRDYHDSLRSNRHKKTFNKLMQETIQQNDGNVQNGQAEVIKTIHNIPNKDEVFAILTRMNKQMNNNNVKFLADNGEIKLNGVSIDMTKFGSMDNEAASFFMTLSNRPEPSSNAIREMKSRLQISFRGVSASEIACLASSLLKIFGNTDETIKERIINAVAKVVMKLMRDSQGCFRELEKIFPGHDKFLRLFTMVSGHFQELINRVEEKYQKWLATKHPSYEEPIFATLALSYAQRAIQLFNFISRVYFVGNNLTETGLKELIDYFYTWFAKQALEFEEYVERKQQRIIHSSSASRKATCPDCGGTYYH